MKVKSFWFPRLLLSSVAQTRTILCGIGQVFREQMLLAVGFIALAVLVANLLFPHDREILNQLHVWMGRWDEAARPLAWQLGTWGDYLTYNVPLSLALWLYGAVTKSSKWRRLAIICFLGATLAGLFNDCFRLTVGRARPDSHLPDHFYGITYALSGGYQSFPSGHAASTIGTGIALLLTELPLGIVTTLFALCVVWARMELERHYPSDVVVGSIIGLYFGVLVGVGAKKRSQIG